MPWTTPMMISLMSNAFIYSMKFNNNDVGEAVQNASDLLSKEAVFQQR